MTFQPGQSGNPKGRPKGRGVTDRLRALLAKDDGAIAEALAEIAVKKANEGDVRFWNAIVDRMEGKVADRVEVEQTGSVRYMFSVAETREDVIRRDDEPDDDE